MSSAGASGIVFRFKVVVVFLPTTPPSSRRRWRAVFLVASVLVATMAAPGNAFAQKGKKAVGVRCDGSSGWASASGVPAILTGNAPLGIYVWNQRGTWRITATGPERKLRTFQGTVSFDAAIATKSFGSFGLEGRSDAVATSGNTVSFRFRNFGQRDGIGVEAPCATTVTITGTIDGVPLAPTQVFIGASGAAPASVPVVLRKDAAPAGTPAVSPVASACPTSSWPANTVGRPGGLKKAKARTLHVWFENGNWQFFAGNDAGRPQVLEGRVTFNAPVTVSAAGLETADDLRVEPRFDGSSVVFSFRTGALSDGFKVSSPCASQLTIELFADGEALATSSLLVGPGSAPATAMPFVIGR